MCLAEEGCLAGEEVCLAGEEVCLAGEEVCLAGEEVCLAGEEVCADCYIPLRILWLVSSKAQPLTFPKCSLCRV